MAVSARVLLYFCVPLMAGLPLYSYHMAVSHHQEKPFPHATITNTACHYPQDVFFRFAMLLINVGIGLLFWAMNKALGAIAEKYQYPRPLSSLYTKVGLLMTFCYALTIGTIDEGKTSHIHDLNAVVFFVLLFVMVNDVTLVCYRLRQWDVRAIHPASWFCKLSATLALTGTWVAQLLLILTNHGSSNDHVVVVEWVSNYTAVFWLASFFWEFTDVYLEILPK